MKAMHLTAEGAHVALLIEKLDAGAKAINVIARYIVFIAFAIMAPTVFVQVLRRFILGSSFPWSEEVARYLMIWITFLGAGIAVRDKAHVAITGFMERLPVEKRRITQLVVETLLAGLFMLIVITGIEQMRSAWSQYASSIQISMAWVYLALPVGGFLMFLNTLVSILRTALKETGR